MRGRAAPAPPFWEAPRESIISNTSATGDFDFAKSWWPCAVIDTLDPKKPHPFTLIGLDLVLWRDGDKKWQAFADACPHRLAPLSEGRLEGDGTLSCAYHGRHFDGEGSCVEGPEGAEGAPSACATRYPTLEEDGILWIFATGGPQGMLESAMHKPRRVEYRDRPGAINFPYNFRDLPYGWDTFMENVTDGSHVAVSHHNVTGNRYTDPAPLKAMSITHRPLSDADGFHIGGHNFQPPCLMNICMSDDGSVKEDDANIMLTLYAVPTKPGWCRLIGNNVILPKSNGSTGGKGFGAFTALPNPPKWMLHIGASFFLHQDMVLLHHQEKLLAKRKGQFLDETFIPTEADRATVAFRRWLRRNGALDAHGHYSVPFEKVSGVSSELPPRQDDTVPGGSEALFDVYNTHVKNCVHCQGALRNLTALRNISVAAAVACVVRAVNIWTTANAVAAASIISQGAMAAAAASAWGTGPAVTPAAIAAAAQVWTPPPEAAMVFVWAAVGLSLFALGMNKLRGLFFTYRFVHQDNL